MKHLVLCLLLMGCVSEQIYNRNELSNQILRVRKDYPEQLTNSMCNKYKGTTCEKLDIVAYDMSDKTFRDKLILFNFICNIADKRYRICSDKPGYCRWTEKCIKKHFGLFGCESYEELYIPASNHQLLIDSGTICSQK